MSSPTASLPPAPLALGMALQIAECAVPRPRSPDCPRGLENCQRSGPRGGPGQGRRLRAGASATATDGRPDGSSVTGGTLYASAPEQLRGAPADTRSDVWALGVLLQELTSGTRPFWRPNLAELLAAILTEPPTANPSHVSPALRRIIERCLARDPASRYQSAGEVLAALEAVSLSRIAPVREEDAAWTLPPPPAVTAAGPARS